MIKVLVAAVPFSPNLGDGLIAEAIKRSGLSVCKDAQFSLLDIAGREGLEPNARFGLREVFIAVSGVLPLALRQTLVKAKIKEMLRQHEASWKKQVAEADLVLIGGGQLLADKDLNFPLKLRQIASICDQVGTPFTFFSVGCSGLWSKEGSSLLDACLKSPMFKGITVRDGVSSTHFAKVFGERLGVDCRVTCDPVVVSEFDGSASDVSADSPLIAVCLSDPKNAAYSGSGAVKGKAKQVEALFFQICETAVNWGWRLRLFNNGAAEDRIFQAKFCEQLSAKGIDAEIFQVNHPMDIVRAVGDANAVFGMRMHALIAAYAQGVPMLGIDWDDKLRGFARRIGAEQVIRDVEEMNNDIATEFLKLSLSGQWMTFSAKDRLREGYETSLINLLKEARDGR